MKRRVIVLITAAVLVPALLIWLLWANSSPAATQVTVASGALPEAFEGFKIAHVSDLHNAVFGRKNEKLLSLIRAAEPDIIAITGDLIDSRHTDIDSALAFVEAAAEIAPVYYVTGNHEWAIGDVPQLKERLRENGVTVLSNQFVPLERNGDVIILAGIDDPNGYADQETPEELAAELTAACGEDAFWILLAHRNDHFPGQYSLLGADLVLSGHGHGGMIRLPGTDGLISTDRTLFPSYTAGLYYENGSTLFVTRGLGNSGPSFRLFNRPEVAVLTLHKG